jgi:hypothetical protein
MVICGWFEMHLWLALFSLGFVRGLLKVGLGFVWGWFAFFVGLSRVGLGCT